MFVSSTLGYTSMSCKSSGGNNSAIALAIMDLPIPGSPISRTLRLCFAAFFIVSTASSCPIIWSINMGGMSISSVSIYSSGLISDTTCFVKSVLSLLVFSVLFVFSWFSFSLFWRTVSSFFSSLFISLVIFNPPFNYVIFLIVILILFF